MNIYLAYEVIAMNKIICPYCGKSHYIEKYSVSTAVYSPIEFIDSVPYYNDPNQYSTFCTCCECGKSFSYSLYKGNVKVEKNYSLDQTITWNAEDSYKFRKKQLQEQIAKLTEELEELEFNHKYNNENV